MTKATPKFKETWKKATTIKLKFPLVGRFYPVTREQLVEMLLRGRMTEERANMFFEKDSLEGHEFLKSEAEAEKAEAKAKAEAEKAEAKAKAEAEAKTNKKK